MQILRKRGHNKGLTGKHKLSRSGDGYTGSLLDTVDVRETIKLKLTSKGDLETHYVPYPWRNLRFLQEFYSASGWLKYNFLKILISRNLVIMPNIFLCRRWMLRLMLLFSLKSYFFDNLIHPEHNKSLASSQWAKLLGFRQLPLYSAEVIPGSPTYIENLAWHHSA